MQPVSAVIPDSRDVATTAPLPRSVLASEGRPNAGSTAVPVIRIVRVTGGPATPPRQVTRTRTVCADVLAEGAQRLRAERDLARARSADGRKAA